MYTRLLIISILISLAHLSESQSVWCREDLLLKEDIQNGKLDQFLNLVRAQENNPTIRTRSDRYYQVVLHVVAREFYQPITRAQVLQQLDVLNNDFAGRGDNVPKLLPEFEPLIADTGIRFCLASTDPDGNPTGGITYNFTQQVNIATIAGPQGRNAIQFDQLGGKTGWDPSRYINIWVGEYGDFLGSAFFPGMAPFPEEIGVIIDIRAFGDLGDASLYRFRRGHTLTHEMGHFFGLIHIWGGGSITCNDSDEVDDTPNADGPYFDCPSGIQQSCGVDNMYQNFMDQTDDRCLAAFTKGQSARMNASIDVFYSNLAIEGPCQTTIQPFQLWYDQLIWAYDRGSGKYVIYHPDGNAGNIQIDVFASDGRLVKHDTWIDDQSYLLDLNVGAAGVYFVRMYDGEHEEVRKVVSF